MNVAPSLRLSKLCRYLAFASAIAFSACSTTSTPSVPVAEPQGSFVSPYVPSEALRAAGIEPNSSDFSSLSETDPRLEMLATPDRALTLSAVYFERWKKGEQTNIESLLRSAHFAQEGISSGGCQPDPLSRCAPLSLIYGESIRALVKAQPRPALLTELSTSKYRVELNGDGGSVDLHEWTITLPKSTQTAKDEPGVRAGFGVPATACRIEPQPKGSYAECLPTTLVLTFEDTLDSQFTRGFLTAIDPSESEFVRVRDSELPLAARLREPFLVATEKGPEPRLTCIGAPDPKRPTIVSIQSSSNHPQSLASAEATLSQDPTLGPVFNYCSFPLLSEANPDGDADTLVALLSSQLAQRSTLFEKPKKADVVLISADSASGRVAGALRERLRTGRSPRSEMTNEPPYVIAGALALSETQSFPTVYSQTSLEESLGMRDMRRTLERVADNYPREEHSLSESAGIDLTVSPVM